MLIKENSSLIFPFPYHDDQLELTISRSDFAFDELLCIGVRKNIKRPFLFVSKVLAKHYPTKLNHLENIFHALSEKIGNCSNPVFIGMAETATGLAQGIFECWLEKYSTPALYLHSTRYQVQGAKEIHFEESHSHAPNIHLYIPQEPKMAEQFYQSETLILIDDELSTGNTFLNLIEACKKYMPNLKEIKFVSITNFMGEENKNRIRSKTFYPIKYLSLIEGRWNIKIQDPLAYRPEKSSSAEANMPYIFKNSVWGRCGINNKIKLSDHFIEQVSCLISPNDNILVLGTGEFIYPAICLAKILERLDVNIVIQSTTRSPISHFSQQFYPNIKTAHLPDIYNEGVNYYLYNYPEDKVYNKIFICSEVSMEQETKNILNFSQDAGVYHILFSNNGEVVVND